MLIEFRVENHRSLREEQVFSMEAGRGGDPDDPRPRRIDGYAEPLLPAAGIYGANASGKTNLLLALNFMRDTVLLSHRRWDPEDGVPRDPFGWGNAGQAPSLFEVMFVADGVRYQYGFVADQKRFMEEWLYAWPRGRKQTWLERDGDSFKFGEQLQGENRLIEKVTRPNALFLSAAVQHQHMQLQPVYSWFRDFRSVNLRHRPRGRLMAPPPALWLWHALRESVQMRLFGEAEEDRRIAAFLELLQAADVGIVDLKLDDDRRTILLQHASTSGDAWLPLEEESQGTQTLFQVGPILLDLLRRGGVLMVDELERSLHPLLALQLVKQFNDPRTNPRNAQLVFTTHDTSLLGSTVGQPALRRDQVWLTEKDGEGATHLYPLTDYKPRKAENLERGYLQGRYGAIPFLGDLARVEG